MDLLWIYYIRSIHIKTSYDIIEDSMTEFKDIVYILEKSENFYFIIGEKIVNSNLKIQSTLLELADFFNINDNIVIEFWINDRIYHPNDNIRLVDLGFNPQINIIEIIKSEYIHINSPNLYCSLRDEIRPIQEIETIRFNLYNNSKLIHVWKILLENLNKIEQDLSKSFNFRNNIADNKYEKATIEQIRNEIVELTESYLAEIKRKLKKIE